MNLKNLKISSQLRLGFGLLLLFVIILGTVSYIQNGLIHQQTETMHNHPLKVSNAIGELRGDILKMRLGMRDLLLAQNAREKQAAIQNMEVSSADAVLQFDVLRNHYLGPRTDVDEAYTAYINWKTEREVNIKRALSGEVEQVKESVLPTGTVGGYRDKLLEKIQKIDSFADKKAADLYATSNGLERSLKRQLILLVVIILIASLTINYILLRNIRTPLKDLTTAARRFQEGDLEARSSYESKNEFGSLSASFNSLADTVQANTVLSEQAAGLAQVMLSEDDATLFFQSTLAALAGRTGSQTAAVYLLSHDKKTYDHFASIGLGDSARPSFAADSFEGEFGAALASRTTQHLAHIPEDTRFLFHTAGGTFIPREIITIPIENNDVVAFISLATVGVYSRSALRLIDTIHATLNSRIEGILAYRTIKEFSEQMEGQNRELEAQKVELTSQSRELTAQNSELEVQKKQLDEASRLKTNFLSNMSHELRTPLNSVIALSGVLGRRLAGTIPAEEYSYLDVIERNGKLLLLLINDILDIARIEAGREEVEITDFNINGLIDDVAGMIRPQADQKNVELLQSDSETALTVTSDAGKCRHILQNLISNAVKFTETGRVTVTARQDDSTVEITVTDTGIGIDAVHLPHIFDEFRQGDGSTSRRFGGTGLGLAIARKYALLLGGTISVTSAPGAGAVFTLSLPLRYAVENRVSGADSPDRYTRSIPPLPQRTDAATSVKTVLLVEDSEPAVIQLKDMLEEDGYRILIARDGGEALGIIADTVPDAMILDLMMPGIDGFEVLRVVREAERTAHIPVLILTARQISKDELSFLTRNNIHQLIQKGDVNRGELQQAVASMVFPETDPPARPQRERRPIAGKPLLLVVEDNPDNMITVKALLADDFTVIGATDGPAGVALAKERRPHLILMDIALPGMDGIEAFKIIRSDPHLQHIPVIALTASAMVSDRETVLAHGFDAYIAKPIDEKQFFKTIHEALYGN
ncbi:MAG: response regulator [Geobacteraceae bacterium]|nr:response regulator [Geobacteraceae bacterium]